MYQSNCSSATFHHFIAFLLLILTPCLLVLFASTAFPRFTLLLDDIKHPAFEAQSIQVQLTDRYSKARQLEIVIASIKMQDYVLENVRLLCTTFKYKKTTIECDDGLLQVPEFFSLPVSLYFSSEAQSFEINMYPAENESWQFISQWDEAAWQSVITVQNVRLPTVSEWLLSSQNQLPEISRGRLNGTVQLSGDGSNLKAGTAELSVDTLAFSDQDGLHAGENITVTLTSDLEYVSRLSQWQWRSDIYWQQGEIFWQPIYMVGAGHHLKMSGIADREKINFQDSFLQVDDVGTFHFSGGVNIAERQLDVFKLYSDDIALSAVYAQVLQPFLQDTAFAEMAVTGHVDFEADIHAGVLQSMVLDLDEVNVVDQHDRFAFQRINAHIPWQSESASVADISILNGHVLSIPIGAVRVPLEINQFNLFLPQLALPVLNGLLTLEEFNANYTETGWRWGFSGGLSPISMAALTDALEIQQMQGTVSGYIPDVHYDGNSVSVNGVLQLNVFDGGIVIHDMKLIEPMGLVPHLKADITMRNLDLELLTGTFSFGKVVGRVDADIHNLELANWRPVHFDARLFSSPGNYSRRISQAAVENISALGGEGAVAAIQRSVLRFFKEFRYSEIGWRCALRLDVCYMGGIEPEPQFGYTLVKGGGIPAITVMGYNQAVGWQELIGRLQRITNENEPIIQ